MKVVDSLRMVIVSTEGPILVAVFNVCVTKFSSQLQFNYCIWCQLRWATNRIIQ